MSEHPALIGVPGDALAYVTGGAGRRQLPSSNPLGFLAAPYKSIVFDVASQIGGKQLAERMYGARTTDEDRARAQEAMKKFLVGGDKLPKGVPDPFGPQPFD